MIVALPELFSYLFFSYGAAVYCLFCHCSFIFQAFAAMGGLCFMIMAFPGYLLILNCSLWNQ